MAYSFPAIQPAQWHSSLISLITSYNRFCCFDISFNGVNSFLLAPAAIAGRWLFGNLEIANLLHLKIPIAGPFGMEFWFFCVMIRPYEPCDLSHGCLLWIAGRRALSQAHSMQLPHLLL